MKKRPKKPARKVPARPATPSLGKRASKIEYDQRVEKAGEMLASGINPGRVEAVLAQEYSVDRRQARRYMEGAYREWERQAILDGPHRREQVVQAAWRLYAKAIAAKDLRCASNVLGTLAKLSGSVSQRDPARDRWIRKLGKPPTDPTKALSWGQKVLMLTLHDVLRNSTLDPERRMRWVAELCKAIGMTFSKVFVEEKLDKIEKGALTDGAPNGEGSHDRK